MSLPTRLTANNTAALGIPVRVWFNGHEIHNVVECDTVEGWAEVFLVDGFGNPLLDMTNPHDPTVRTKILTGDIEARPK